MADVTVPWGLPFPEDNDFVNVGPADFEALATAVAALLTPFDQGARSSRPVSTVGTPGKPQFYRSTPDGGIDIDIGTGWKTLRRGIFATLPTDSGNTPPSLDDGMEIRYQTAGMLAAGQGPWTLVYEASYSGSSKWAVIAAMPWVKQAAASVAVPTTFGDFSDGQPSVALPGLGDYALRLGAYILLPAGSHTAAVAATATGLALSSSNSARLTGTGPLSVSTANESPVVGISGTLKLGGAASSGVTVQERFLSVTPQRLG